MNASKLKQICAAFPAADQRLYGPPSNILVYSVGDKKFAYFKTSQPEQWRFSIRVSPDRFIELTDVPGIKPARYMARFHWITIVEPGCLPRGYLMELIEGSYRRALDSLGKQKRTAILEAACPGT